MRIGTCLQLDVGNSSAKWRLLDEGGRMLARGRYQPTDVASREALLGCTEHVDAIWIASVADNTRNAELAGMLVDRWGVEPWLPRSERQTGDLVSSYAEPERMGVDRWLAMLGARSRTSERFCVVDAGSALTIDLVDASGRHEGGYIIPGPELMEKALLLDTDRVRYEEAADHALAPGHSTAEAVRNGIALAQAGALTLALGGLGKGVAPGDTPCVFLCGGGSSMLAALYEGEFVQAPDLVFDGLEVMAQLRNVSG